MKAIRSTLDRLGFTVVETAKYTQFVRIMSPRRVKVDLLAAPLGNAVKDFEMMKIGIYKKLRI